jgi:signal-transduction protein with cAMP-binding, CBS, and nucleotidyltransferase domain
MNAKEMMNACFVELGPTDSVHAAARAMRDEMVGLVCISDEAHRPIGVVTDRDLVTRVCAAERPIHSTELGEIMSHHPLTCGLDASASEIENIMADGGVARVLVTADDGRLVGVVTLAEIWHYESPLTAGNVSRRVTQRHLRVQTGSTGRHTSPPPRKTA